MTPSPDTGTPTDELLLGILLAVGGGAVGSTLNSEFGSILTLLGLSVGVGAYVVSALSAATDPAGRHGPPPGEDDRPGETEARGDS